MVYYSGGIVVSHPNDDMSPSTAAMFLLFGSIIFATIGMTIRIWYCGNKKGMFVYMYDDIITVLEL